jgi:undecaprenyl-phosphate galactose phosphotransferase
MNRQSLHKIVCGIAIMASDVVAWCCVAALFKLPREGTLVIAGVWGLGSLLWLRSYSRRVTFWNELKLEIKGMAMMALLLALALLLANGIHMLNGVINLVLSITALVLVLRTATRWVLIKTGLYAREVMIFGTGDNAKQAAKAMVSDATLGYVIRGFVDPKATSKGLINDVDVLQWPKSEKDYLQFKRYECVVALEDDQRDLGVEIMRNLVLWNVKEVHVVPSMRGVPLYNVDVSHFFSHEVMMLHITNNLMNPVRRIIKRLFDIVTSLVIMTLLIPVFVWISYKIWRVDGAPIIFSQTRIGRNLKPFKFYKFRSMVNSAEAVLRDWEKNNSPEWQEYVTNNFKLVNDPRITKIGAFIRKTSLDELPQLFNVLCGDMSLVGPRPLLQREQINYGDGLNLYGMTAPGMTGLWQISGRSKTKFIDRVNFDAWYLKNSSLWTDIVIMFKTVTTLLEKDGAY